MSAPLDPGRELAWSVRPFAADRTRGVLAALVALSVVAAAFRLGGPLVGAFSALVLGGGIGPFFVTTRYRLSPEGVEVRSPFQRVQRPWSAFLRAYIGERGVSLSPFTGRHLLEPYRSVMLRYGEHRDQVLEWVRRFGPREEAA